MVKPTSQWRFDIARGPDCLFVKIRPPKDRAVAREGFAEVLWSILARHFTYRLVLEMDEVDGLPSRLIGELLALSKRISERGGMMRLCGLKDPCQQALKHSHLHGQLSSYGNRIDALLGNTLPGESR